MVRPLDRCPSVARGARRDVDSRADEKRTPSDHRNRPRKTRRHRPCGRDDLQGNYHAGDQGEADPKGDPAAQDRKRFNAVRTRAREGCHVGILGPGRFPRVRRLSRSSSEDRRVTSIGHGFRPGRMEPSKSSDEPGFGMSAKEPMQAVRAGTHCLSRTAHQMSQVLIENPVFRRRSRSCCSVARQTLK